jgi:signal transduction histidine kinase
MRERAEAIGGALAVASAPGVGTRVVLHVPAKPREVVGARSPR